ncbi:hypothetical protein CLU79DRAFT_843642 [Phycomyces nitens]|nr:hypothetical protein CLU79DRAFT_843642 [Phycomyces nitens]
MDLRTIPSGAVSLLGFTLFCWECPRRLLVAYKVPPVLVVFIWIVLPLIVLMSRIGFLDESDASYLALILVEVQSWFGVLLDWSHDSCKDTHLILVRECLESQVYPV